MYKRLRLKVVIAILMTFALLAAACGDDDDAQTAGSDDEGGLTVALMLQFMPTDLSWGQRSLEGAQKLLDDGAIADLIVHENIGFDIDAFTRATEGAIADGADLVIAAAFDWGEPILQNLSVAHPDVFFAWSGGIGSMTDTVAEYNARFYEGSYLAGILAAGATESNVIGSVSGMDLPICHAMHAAFLAGAQSVNADITLQTAATGDWNDVALNKEAILAQIDQGAEVFSTCGGGPALGAIEAAAENGFAAVGYLGDMSVVNPDVVLTSILWNTDILWGAMVADIEAGTFAGKLYELGVASGSVEVVLNPAYTGTVPSAEVFAAYEAAVVAIQDGTLVVEYDGGF